MALGGGLLLSALLGTLGLLGLGGAPPGGLSALTRALPADTVLSYGPSSRNTLTLSSLDGGRVSVAIQREFVALNGRAVERQELVVPSDGRPPDLLLAEAGAALLLGLLPAEG